MKSISALLLVCVGAAGLSLLSRVHYAAEPEQAVIRLSWRARGERVRRCRRLTADELARLPPHMRQEEICQRGVLPYQLHAVVDGRPIIDEIVRAGGARSDRPLFVFHELLVAPGVHRLVVQFERRADAGEPAAQEPQEHETPAHLSLDETITVAPRAIVLVTYDDERQRLRLLAAPAGGP